MDVGLVVSEVWAGGRPGCGDGCLLGSVVTHRWPPVDTPICLLPYIVALAKLQKHQLANWLKWRCRENGPSFPPICDMGRHGVCAPVGVLLHGAGGCGGGDKA